MKSQGLDCASEAVPNLTSDAARAASIEHFKEVRRLKTQLDQYTDLTEENRDTAEQVLPGDNLLGFRGAYARLPKVLCNQSKQFCDLARQIMETTTQPETIRSTAKAS